MVHTDVFLVAAFSNPFLGLVLVAAVLDDDA